MPAWYDAVVWVVLAAFSTLNLLLLLSRSERAGRARRWVGRTVHRFLGPDAGSSLDWRPLLVVAAVAFAVVSAIGIGSGQYGCVGGGSDAVTILHSGQAVWMGQNPFLVPECHHMRMVPYGFASVLLTAVGSLAGLPGVYALWGAVALALIPLTWAVAGPDRRFITLYVATSALFIPIAFWQIDGLTNAIVPVAVLLSLYLASRNAELLAAIVGGFVATARFPSLLPILGETGAFPRRRALSFGVAVAVFGAFTAASYGLWGSEFLTVVFFHQFGVRTFSLNLYGILLLTNALPAGPGIEAVQAVLTVALLIAVLGTVRSPVASAAILLVGFALVTPFLSYNILIWLLPVALLGVRPQWWLWGIALVGSLNYELALNVWAWADGVSWPSMVFDVALTVLLLGLFVELWRQEWAARGGRARTVRPDLAPVPPGTP
ncbi:MAG TPA: hypothetical protein VEG42_03995 [Thermoplasmata archaeon]|nr:hypothetical protein [Thermoplasmata archaeon]